MRKKRDDPLAEYRAKRDFKKTGEPAGAARRAARRAERAAAPRARPLRFVIQKHAATSLHFDLRLECDGVMKSWAVPRGLSLDPANKRLAMEVEDHPMEYNDFEGTIPAGEYGGGTVMIWDAGTYFADEAEDAEDDEAAIRRGHSEGKISFFLEGTRLRGSFALVRTDAGAKPKWLVIKHRDEHVSRSHDPVDVFDTSVVTGRTMQEIEREERARQPGTESVEPMLPVEVAELPEGEDWIYDELRDGLRVLAYITPESHRVVAAEDTTAARVEDIADQLGALARRTGRSFVLDGVVAHAKGEGQTLFVADILYDDGDVVVDEPWRARRARLETLFARRRVKGVHLTKVMRTTPVKAIERARAEGWAGIVAKRVDSRYRAGRGSGDWRVLDI